MAEKLPSDPPPPKAGEEPAPARHQDDLLDEALDETFPASDPIAPAHPD